MRTVQIFLVLMATFFTGNLAAQVQKPKPGTTVQTKPIKPAKVAVDLKADSILPIAQSNLYKRLIKAEETKLKTAFKRNLSGELTFYADSTQCYECWFKENTRFKNNQKELDDYLNLLRTTHDLFIKPTLSAKNRRDLLDKGQMIERYRDQIIRPVDMNGQRQVGCNVVLYSAGFVTFTVKVSSSKIKNIKNVTVYAGTENAVKACGCSECFSTKFPPTDGTKACDGSDIDALKKLPNIYLIQSARPNTFEQNLTVPPGDYHFLVVERVNNKDIPRYHQTSKVCNNCTVNISF